MKKYTYTETEYFVLQHLYYSMGVNRMKWHDYRELMIPSLKEEIMLALSFRDCSRDLTSRYNSHDIDTVIRKIKEKFEIFGHYEGYSEINDSIQRYSWSQ
jgi:hypothetical protein